MAIANEASDCVFIRGLEFVGNHGYSAAERKGIRRFRVDIALRRSLRAPARSDKLADTVDYFKICAIAVKLGTEATFKLLEALAGAMAAEIHALYADVEIEITLEKLAPPCPGIPASCGVTLVVAPIRS
ncbi:MAG: dihydroneopterin aldolase [Myxococcales bacterium]|nr:dihydroneopterin aldolase [Myxococcales bacterium]